MKKTAIVTGSSRGIGFAIAKQLGLDGYNIVMVATGPQEKNQAALDELKTQGIDCAYVQANIGSADDRKKILDGALAAFGRVDVLVNNAGVAPKVRADLLDMSEESFDYVVGINTKGNMFLTQLVAKQMISQEPVDGRKGVIVNVSSCSSVVSSTNRGEYCVSKAGISMLTTLYADRLAAEGILVNEVRPGVIATDMTSKVQGKYDALIEKGTFPIARWGTPEDVAAMAEQSGCDGYMIARGAEGNPWIFRQILHYFETGEHLARPDFSEVTEMLLRHAKMQIDCKGDYTGIREIRKHAAWYTAGYPHGARLRVAINQVENYEQLKTLLMEYFV